MNNAADTRDAPSPVFRIVVICTGNRFRSPLVEAFIGRLTAGLPVEVSSRGALELGGAPPLEGAVKGATKLGFDISGHRSRCLRNSDLRDVDLVLGFERAHVSQAVVDCGARKERTFTLPELLDLLEALPDPDPKDTTEPVQRARTALERAAQYRRPREGKPLPELADPLGASDRVQRDTVRRLHEASAALVRHLFGVLPAAAERKIARG